MTGALVIAVLVVAGTLMLAGGKLYWRRRISRWATREGLRLLDFRGARLYEGPRPLLRSDSQFAFRVVVEDTAGATRTAWLTFGKYLSFWPRGEPDVRWID